MRKIFERYYRTSACLPLLEKVGFHTGVASFIIGTIQIEMSNPIWGSANALIGTALTIGSLSTSEAVEALDNRGNDLL